MFFHGREAVWPNVDDCGVVGDLAFHRFGFG